MTCETAQKGCTWQQKQPDVWPQQIAVCKTVVRSSLLACWQIASSQIQFVGMLADCEQSDAVCWYVVVEEVEYLQGLNM